MSYYKVLISCGHVGNSKEITIARYFKAKNIIEAFESGNRMPRAKRKHSYTSVLLVKPIDETSYIDGKFQERTNSYLTINLG
ncbi:conserved hypothetical protein [Thermoanaerobacterium thermosaccharolyticum DSM 571]|jgi:hypothetical protein|uniref:Uncharacterized protein n=1 Tax=Thermoanaerobacterium thermosaccharolyticum (strain ATCC 7956 / DSM 571 / NCIMB 9385 / NCA 3814 / NCTC 13789 / WDCM 00135 / 2032) TaxID=580327 RepID=D9TPA5_THETC|nr:hypothetical protein [Thermoanaerobacterium thermosaccharolyticum]ADL69085.1 conserved hypothetical protein [Thermoanaerobacterium thermosaccharolyticum DSM 571]MCP2240695.1 hypothetical protein [Thermoanaerobacterium thermosaccharolyticum]